MALTALLTPEAAISYIDGVSNALKWAKAEIISLTRKEREMVNAHYALSAIETQVTADAAQADAYLDLADTKLGEAIAAFGGAVAPIIAATGVPATLTAFKLDANDLTPDTSHIEVSSSFDDPFTGVVVPGDQIQIVKCSIRSVEGLVGTIASVTSASDPTKAKIVFTADIFTDPDRPQFHLVGDAPQEVNLLVLRKVADFTA